MEQVVVRERQGLVDLVELTELVELVEAEEAHNFTNIILNKRKMVKVLHITPHLSTGGMPEVVYQIISKTNKYINNYCYEYINLSDEFVVQKNKIKNILKDNLETSSGLINYINKVDPDIVFVHEQADSFMIKEDLLFLYNNNRKYKIIEASHDSYSNIENKTFFPERYALITDFQAKRFKSLNIPITQYETDIENKTPDVNKAREKLGFENDYLHIINIGILTPRKNQKESLEIADLLKNEKIKFHFVGVMAGNFQDYWQPLYDKYKNSPNIKFWGQRDDVDLFYQAADLMLFSSKGEEGNMETKPLVIREATEYNLPIFMYKLDTYGDYYDNFKNITYINNKNPGAISDNIIAFLDSKIDKPKFEYCFHEEEFKLDIKPDRDIHVCVEVNEISSKQNIISFYLDLTKDNWFWIIPLSKDTFKLFDYQNKCKGLQFLIKHNNRIVGEYKHIVNNNTEYDFKEVIVPPRTPTWMNYMQFFELGCYDFIPKGLNKCVDIGANVGLSCDFLIQRGAKELILVDGDDRNCLFLNKKYWKNKNIKICNKCISGINSPQLSFEESSNSIISQISDKDSDNKKIKTKLNLNLSSLIEEYNWTNEYIDLVKIDIEGAEYDLFENDCNIDFSKIKYFVIEMHKSDKNQEVVLERLKKYGYELYAYPESGEIKEIPIYEVDSSNQSYTLFARNKNLNHNIVQIATYEEKGLEKNLKSRSSIERIGAKTRFFNAYKGLPPKENAARPNMVQEKLGEPNIGILTEGHYGAFSSFKEIVLTEFNEDFLLLLESDSYIGDVLDFENKLKEAKRLMLEHDIHFFSFGGRKDLQNPDFVFSLELERLNDWSIITDKAYYGHGVLIHKKDKEFYHKVFQEEPWDSPDLFFVSCLQKYNKKIAVTDEPLITQVSGYSIIDKKHKEYKL